MVDKDISQELQAQVQSALEKKTPLQIIGGNSKAFYGRPVEGQPLYTHKHQGILNYEPTELVLTARAGTPLVEVERVLAEHGQQLPSEPPHFAESATVGGTLACNLSGPRRPYAGAVRDHVLGVKIINGKGEILHFGGEVMKNVAGYDLSRLMAGALGTLGVILEVSYKVKPIGQSELTLYRDCTIDSVIKTMNEWAGYAYPLTGALFDGNRLYGRFSGSESAVKAAKKKFGGEELAQADGFWHKVKEQQHAFFNGEQALWRVSVAPNSPALHLPGKHLIDWGGALRWYRGDIDVATIQRVAREHGGHAQLFRGGNREHAFQPLNPALLQLHKNLKHAMDPQGIFNPGKMYTEI